MTKTTFLMVTSIIFLIIGVIHVLRIFGGWDAQIGSFIVPMWASYLAAIVSLFLSYQAFRLKKEA